LLLISGRAVLTGRLDQPEIPDGGVVVDADRIVAVGRTKDLRKKYRFDAELGGGDRVVMPGLVSAHQHGAGVASTQLGCPDQPFEAWLLAMFGIPPLDVRLDTQLHALRLLDSGVTSTIHSHYTRDPANYETEVAQILEGYRDVGLRVAFAPCFIDQNLLTYGQDDAFLRALPAELAAYARTINGGGIDGPDYVPFVQALAREAEADRERILFGPVAPQWCTNRVLEAIGEAVKASAMGVHLHLLESPAQRRYLDLSLGRSVVDFLAELGLLGSTVSFAHGVWLRRDEIEQISEAGASVVINAGCNLRLGNGIAPVGELVASGVRIAFGTDDMTLDDDDDLLRELRLTLLLARYTNHWLDPAWAISAATLGGAKAALLDDLVGSIEPGKRADLLLLDADRLLAPWTDPDVSMAELVVTRASGRDVRTVIIDGVVVFDGGRHRSLDKTALDRALADVARHQSVDPVRRSTLRAARGLATAHQAWQQTHHSMTSRSM
jgi:cytosine/adenosine deaminase-related metal-dependent hydrolase